MGWPDARRVNVGLAWDGGSTGRLERPGESPVATNGPVSNAAGYFGVNALLSARLALLAQRGEAVMLAQPQLLARSGASATFLAGGELPYVSTDATAEAPRCSNPMAYRSRSRRASTATT